MKYELNNASPTRSYNTLSQYLLQQETSDAIDTEENNQQVIKIAAEVVQVKEVQNNKEL